MRIKRFDIGDRLKECLYQYGLSLNKLEVMCGFSNRYLAHAKFRIPVEKIQKICDVLPGLNCKWLATGEWNMFVDNPVSLEIGEYVVTIEFAGSFTVRVKSFSKEGAIRKVRRSIYGLSETKMVDAIGLHETNVKTEIL
jgi:transcriptional regulator with XRE-family HTH domain